MADRSSVLMPTLLALLLGSVAILRVEPNLTSLRPSPAAPCLSPTPPASDGLQTVPAMLWDDPFRAVYDKFRADEARKREASKENDDDERKEPPGPKRVAPPPLQRQQVATVAAALLGSGPVPAPSLAPILLGVLARSGDQEEDRESRLRSRHAVHAALGMHPYYHPKHPQHLGYVVDAYPPDAHAPSGRPLPFEVFEPKSKPGDAKSKPKVVVLWLDEDVLGDALAHGLAYVLDAWAKETKSPRTSQFLIGPTSSTGLDALLVEEPGIVRSKDKPGDEAGPPVVMYSPWATKESQAYRPWLTVDKPATTIQVIRTIGDDSELTGRLCNELRLRGVNKPEKIALLIEWDTAYGRGLFDLLDRPKAEGCSGGLGHAPEDFEKPENGPRLIRYTRGLDGIAATGNSDRAPKGGEGARASTVPASEGTSRLDAVARLRTKMQFDGSGIEAVGILGTDVYDKLLLLRALRQSCPNAVFFTTDLDARLLDPADRDITRNLVVASHYGLELSDRLQGGVLPFRSGYQTAVFLSAGVALNKPGFEIPGKLEAPRVYEIGRFGPFDLTLPVKVADFHPLGARETQFLSFSTLAGWLRLLAWIVFLSAIAFLAISAAQRIRSDKEPWRTEPSRDPAEKTNRRLGRWILRVLFVVAVVGALDGFWREDGEPFVLAQGISVWPTCILRVLVGGLSMFYGLRVLRALDDVARDITADPTFKLAGEPSESGDPGASDTRFARLKARIGFTSNLHWGPKSDVPTAAGVLERCKVRGGSGATIRRVRVLVILYCAASIALFALTVWPSSPTRGTLAWLANALTCYPCLVLLFALNTAACDAAGVQLALLRNFTLRNPTWPPRAVAEAARNWEVSDEAAQAWLTHRVLSKRGKVVEKFVYYPFVILLLLVVIQNPVFDDFSFPGSLLFVYGLLFGFSALAGYLLARATAAARANVVHRIRGAEQAERSMHPDKPADPDRMAALAALKAEIQKDDTSAFAGLLSSPTIRAMLIPSGGIGALTLIERFMRPG